jgi:hypothetical protein
MEHPMQCCAICGGTEDLRLFEIGDGANIKRRWWCPECWFLARRRGEPARLCPVWIERAALRQLPMKPVEVS